ncbi:hypothetical protein CEP51_016359, partial [Fusarium floridanum]
MNPSFEEIRLDHISCFHQPSSACLSAATVMHGSIPTSSLPPVNDWSQDTTQGLDPPIRRRRRRILSCETCRRLKCRCVTQDGELSCVRCRNLRLRCSKAHSAHGDAVPVPALTSRRVWSRKADDVRDSVSATSERESAESEPDIEIHRPESPLNDAGSRIHVSRGHEVAYRIDNNVQSSPAEVIRRVGRQLNGGRRRTFERDDDLVNLGVLDENTANGLVQQCSARLQHTLSIKNACDLAASDMRVTSPFLHSVCCLLGLRWTRHMIDDDSILHREVYEIVRRMLGDLMLATPLPLGELSGILVMSLFASSPTRGPEYIDSWLLSGHCAQQGMLSLNFSDIATRITSNMATDSDYKAVHLWANICLVNLHWGALTGRPPTVPPGYLDQCKLLLNFEHATLRDCMLVAEVRLYTTLHDQFTRKEYLDPNGGSMGLRAWESEWEYLFTLPTSGTLKMSQSTAWLLLARRTMEARKEPMQADLPDTSPSPDDLDKAGTERTLCKVAIQVLQAFLALGDPAKYGLPEFYRSCLAYSLLVLT